MAAEAYVDDAERPERTPRWRGVARLAAQQHGAVSHAQLLALGFSPRAISRLVEGELLHPIHRGVYAVGHRLLPLRGRWMAGVLASGPDAVLSHRSAAALHGVRPPLDRVDVTVGTRRRSRHGLRLHQAPVAADERTVVDGVPVTGILRTLLDLAATADRLTVERAAHEAEARRITDRIAPETFVDRHRGRRGIATLEAVLADGGLGLDRTESALEERFLELVDEFGIPRPQLNVVIHGRRCDAVWPGRRLIVELDSRTWHATSAAFERDRTRDRALHVARWRTVRVTDRQLREERRVLAADLLALTA